MKNKRIWLATAVLLCGCYKNITNYYADGQDKGLAIFSNTGNNIFTCYVNGQPWRTVNRITGGFLTGSTSEIHIYKQTDSTAPDWMVIEWDGFLEAQPNDYNTIALYLKVPKGFTRNGIDSLQGQRIAIDSSKGFFYANISGYNTEAGSGNIYFKAAGFDSTAAGSYSGGLSGILEATFPDFTITRGRFDDQLTELEVEF